ncbi:MAG: ribosome assembly cofactor RimP [Bacteroidales bacterium]|nr:ribosome assembly cofactor RimP [Bacteroidales bacterium]
MIDKLQVIDIVHQALEGTDRFLVDLKVTPDNRIYVSIDGDNGVQIDDCVELSRAIEGKLSRDEEDYELNVASAGVDMPLRMTRQYKKNVGRDLSVVTTDGTAVEGQLTEATDEQITLQPRATKKHTPEPVVLPYGNIKTAKVMVKF